MAVIGGLELVLDHHRAPVRGLGLDVEAERPDRNLDRDHDGVKPSSSAKTSRFSASHGVKSDASLAHTDRALATRLSRPRSLLSNATMPLVKRTAL